MTGTALLNCNIGTYNNISNTDIIKAVGGKKISVFCDLLPKRTFSERPPLELCSPVEQMAVRARCHQCTQVL